MYQHECGGVRISVAPDYLEDESDPDEGHYVWSYTIEIENTGPDPVQLVARKWVITDSLGRTEHVQGLGVIGEQPVIEPGESFRYTSGAPLRTPSGFMTGSYEMRRTNGESFAAPIPGFSLDRPHDRVHLH
ncbi:Co2+/Mg2+ efflux protein ApaG [Maricaulis sp. CAU 1757]